MGAESKTSGPNKALGSDFRQKVLNDLREEWFERRAPRLVRCAITGYGSTGPKAQLPGYDFILQAESGLMSITGEVDGGPTKYGVAIVDVCTGMLACNAILAALHARQHAASRAFGMRRVK